MFRKAFSMSAIQAISYFLKRISTDRRSGLRFGPVSNRSFRLGPNFVFAAPSKTGLIFVVDLSPLKTGSWSGANTGNSARHWTTPSTIPWAARRKRSTSASSLSSGETGGSSSCCSPKGRVRKRVGGGGRTRALPRKLVGPINGRKQRHGTKQAPFRKRVGGQSSSQESLRQEWSSKESTRPIQRSPRPLLVEEKLKGHGNEEANRISKSNCILKHGGSNR